MDHKHDTRVAEICDAIQMAAPPEWDHLTMSALANIESFEIGISAQTAGGRFAGAMKHISLAPYLKKLRDDMYEPTRGAWLSAVFVIHRHRSPETTFNYNEKPDWSPELDPAQWAQDLKAYPRDPQQIPPWLREIVDSVEDPEFPDA